MQATIPQYENATFQRGVEVGISWYKTGDPSLRFVTAQLIVDFIRDNILEPEFGAVDEEEFFRHAGFLTGWIIGQFVG